MQLTKIEKNGVVCAVVNSNDPVITDAQSALDVLMSAKYDIGTKNIIIDKKLVIEDFFILSKGIAGEVLCEICELRWSHCNLRRLFTLHKQTIERLYL